MSSNNNQFQSPFLITTRKFPQKSEDLEPVLSKSYTDIANNVNNRTIGIYNTVQIVSGNKYYATNANDASQVRQSYRQIYPFGAIAAGASLTISHGITGITQIAMLYGACITDASVITTAKYEPIPFVSTTLNQQVALYMNDTIITIVNGAGNNNILSGTIVVEYLLS